MFDAQRFEKDGQSPSTPLCEPVPDTLGERLTAARLRNNWSLDDAVDATKIRIDFLRALESDDWAALPGRAYGVGFVKTYAQALGLDAEAAAQHYREAMRPHAAGMERLTPVDRPAIRAPRSALAFALAALGVLGLAVWRPDAQANYRYPPTPAPSSDYRAWLAPEPSAALDEKITLKAHVRAFLEAQDAAGRLVFRGDLQAGEAFAAEPGVRVNVENAGAFEMVVSGVSRGRLGPAGVPLTEVRLDRVAEGAP
ncbi:MAG: helix-turn-helix domain-containing protein [Maricaulaceae bacterium]